MMPGHNPLNRLNERLYRSGKEQFLLVLGKLKRQGVRLTYALKFHYGILSFVLISTAFNGEK